jgi:hypothetical protein
LTLEPLELGVIDPGKPHAVAGPEGKVVVLDINQD